MDLELIEGLKRNRGQLDYLRDKGIGGFELESVALEHLRPNLRLNLQTTQSHSVRSISLYKNLCKLLETASSEIEDSSKEYFERLTFKKLTDAIVICQHRPMRITADSSVL